MTIASTPAEVLYRPPTPELRFLPEGPYTCADRRFSWVAIQHGNDATVGSLNVFDLTTGESVSHQLPGRPGFAFPTDREGVFVAGVERSVGLFDTATGEWSVLQEDIDCDVEGTIINDGMVFGENLIFGCKDLNFSEKKAGLYLLRGSDQSLVKFRSDQVCSNGKAIVETMGGLRLLDIDTPTKRVVSYPVDLAGGTLGDAVVVVDLTSDEAFPDGMILTPDGGSVIVAFYNPNPVKHGVARQYSLNDGSVEAEWTCPDSPRVTCPQLIATPEGIRLVLTTAVEHMTPDEEKSSPNAGCLFVAETDFSAVAAQPVFPVRTA